MIDLLSYSPHVHPITDQVFDQHGKLIPESELYSFSTKETDQLAHLQRLKKDYKYFFCHIVLESCLGDYWQEKYHFNPAFLLMMEYALELLKGGSTETAISIPPRNSKSLIFSIGLSMFILQIDPSTTFISVSNTLEVVKDFQKNRKLIYNHPDYQKIIDWEMISLTESSFKTSASGSLYSMTLTAIKTGLGGTWIIVDDGISATQYQSELHQKKSRTAFTVGLFSRQSDKKKGRFLMVSQRLGHNDLVDLVIPAGYKYLEVQARAEEEQVLVFPISGRVWKRSIGDLICPKYEDDSVFNKIAKLDPNTFKSQYQQRPLRVGNTPLDLTNCDLYRELTTYEKIILSIDTAASTGAKAANWGITIWGILESGRVHLIRAEANPYDYPEGKRYCKAIFEKFGCTQMLIENKSTGLALIPEFLEQGYDVVSVLPTKSKEDRFLSAIGFINKGFLMIPDLEYLPFCENWLEVWKTELIGFPLVGKRDLVDSTSQLINYLTPSKVHEINHSNFFNLG